MDTLFSAAEGSLLLRLIIAHCVVDFFLQTGRQVKNKQENAIRSKALYFHTLWVVAITWLALWNLSLWSKALIIGLTHFLIDLVKIEITNRVREKNTGFPLKAFLLDQLLHMLVIISVWLWIINGWSTFSGIVSGYLFHYSTLLYILGYIIVVGPVRFIIRLFVQHWEEDIERTNDGLENAGITIGVLERVLVLTFVYISQFAAIGFLVAAKSILRLIDKPSVEDTNKTFSPRKHTEYVLIGTFLSFGSALAIGLLINWLLSIHQ